MSAVLHGITDLEEGMEKINDYVKDIAHCSELYVCLYENWDSAPRHIRMLAAIEQFGMQEEDNMDEDTDTEKDYNSDYGDGSDNYDENQDGDYSDASDYQ